MVRELLLAPEGRVPRLAEADRRRESAESAALAVELILDGARRQAQDPTEQRSSSS